MIPRSCTKCGGDMFLNRNIEGPDSLDCLQCGHSVDVFPAQPPFTNRTRGQNPAHYNKRRLMREVPAL